MFNINKIESKRLRKTSKKESEDFFLNKISLIPLPQHIAIIMDGNGRWAKKQSLPRIAGHRKGAKVTHEIIKAAAEIKIKYLTLYTFSTENWKRPKKEVTSLMNLLKETLKKELEELNKNNVKLNVLGNLEELPDSTRKCFEDAILTTSNNSGLILNLALNYGGRQELVDAIKKIVKDALVGKIEPETISSETVSNYLYTANIPDPELLIRTSGELRLSNFLTWQSIYTELWVTQTLWPDFSPNEFYEAIYDFQQRKRRFGEID
ncbi:MAG: isoprenyl transferase [Candidatus Subteraquimicrobiales bacterium]|nr:isoprenyl transferase [Candidatus Subteraquimicrobiales bacterium]